MEQRSELFLESGGIQVRAEYRHAGGDEGWTFHVYGEEGGKKKELLRFDCFQKNPHYHYYAAGGKNEVHSMDKSEIPIPLKWVMMQMKGRLPAMIRQAGYGELAQTLDQQAVAQALTRLENEIVKLTSGT